MRPHILILFWKTFLGTGMRCFLLISFEVFLEYLKRSITFSMYLVYVTNLFCSSSSACKAFEHVSAIATAPSGSLAVTSSGSPNSFNANAYVSAAAGKQQYADCVLSNLELRTYYTLFKVFYLELYQAYYSTQLLLLFIWSNDQIHL